MKTITHEIIAGIDEAGRGPIAGPVVAGAVILAENFPRKILKDSKVLTENQREKLYEKITTECIWGVGEVSAKQIDKIGIKKATHLAMKKAVDNLMQKPNKLHIDGNDNFVFDIKSEYFIKGDTYIPEISAASIVAKVTRDRKMHTFAIKFPNYLFEKHKGYCTRRHVEIVKHIGPCELHRKTFVPIKTN